MFPHVGFGHGQSPSRCCFGGGGPPFAGFAASAAGFAASAADAAADGGGARCPSPPCADPSGFSYRDAGATSLPSLPRASATLTLHPNTSVPSNQLTAASAACGSAYDTVASPFGSPVSLSL